MRLVLDASIAIGWILPDEVAHPLRLDRDSELHVPPVFAYEIAHAVLKAVRRQRLTEPEARLALKALDSFPIVTDDTSVRPFPVADFALTHRVNAYDAAYLALAMRLNLPLATLDGPLSDAARATGVALVAL